MSLNKLSLGGKRNLARKVDETVGLDGLAVGADRSGSVLSKDLLMAGVRIE